MPKHRLKFDTKIIDFRESLESSSIQGMPAMVRHFSDVAELSNDEAKQGTPEQGPVKQATPDEGTFKQGTLEVDQIADVSPNATFAALAALGLPTTDPPQLRPATLAQHAHTPGEELLYGKMWGKGSPLPGQQCRILTCGLKKLAALVGLARTENCRNNLQGLIQKLAIDDLGVAPNPNFGRVYRIWDQSAILQRRRDHGLTHYYKLRRAVFLVNPDRQNGVPHNRVPSNEPSQKRDSTNRLPQNTGPTFDSGVPQNGVRFLQNGAPQKAQNRVPQNRSLLIRNRNPKEDVCQELPEIVVDAVLDVMGECDDDSAGRIVAAARAARIDIPDQVIVQIIHMKGPRIRTNRNIDYPLRVLESAVAETAQGVTGTNLCKAHYRAVGSQRSAEPISEQWRLEQEAALLDPSTSDAEKDVIRRCLDME